MVSLTRTRFQFQLPERQLPAVNVRPLRPDDLGTCCEIYRLNEPGRFPDGYYDIFYEAITNTDALFLGVEFNGKVVAFGGVGMTPAGRRTIAQLSFGIIHPEAQRLGVGTVLLLARLTALPEPQIPYVVTVSPVALSKSFFEQFGFSFTNRFKDIRTNCQFELLAVRFNGKDWMACRELLEQAGVKLEITEAVPRVSVEVANANYVIT